MIQFFIGENEVVLPNDFSYTLIENNPEINNEGEFTLDMTISLREPKNAIAFGFLNRLNLLSTNKTATAKSIDNGVTKFGTAIISKNTDTEVTFQFVSGNSELNYNAKADNRKIWELEGWGSEVSINFLDALRSIENPGYGSYGSFPHQYYQNYVCAPVMIGTEVVNKFTVNDASPTVPYAIGGIDGKIIMQPYVLYYVNKLPELIGYTLKNNILNSNLRARQMYLVNAVDSKNYADALPDMSVSEFIESIENFFNVSFLVNNIDKTISIESISSNINNKRKVLIDKVLDSYARVLSEESKSIRFDFTKISYDLPDSLYFKYQKIQDDILAKCEMKEFSNYSELFNYVVGNDFRDKLIIYRDLEKMDDYCFADIPNIALFSRYASSYGFLKMINKFKSIGTRTERELVFKIIPAAIIKTELPIKFNNGSLHTTLTTQSQLPVSSNTYFIHEQNGFVNSVEKGLVDISRSSLLEVALYSGKIQLFMFYPSPWGWDKTITYPFSHIDTYPEFGIIDEYQYPETILFENWRSAYYTPKITTTMRLTGSNSVISDYHQKILVDTSKEYTFNIIDGPDIKSSNLFMINNQMYMPISLERVKSNSNNKSLVKGTFYRML